MSALTGEAAAALEPPEADSSAATILFPQGLPGFPGTTRFALRPAPAGDGDFLLLQCAEDSALRLLVLRYTPHLLPLHPQDVEAACAR
ncbi:MAG: flagellar assembly protein FliW, partial [Geminicoccaceae bacterium]